MISATSSNVNPQQVESPAPLALLLNIPRDIAPNILSRLPAPSLLNLARTCKQLPIVNKQDLLKDWASRELIDISLLDGEPLWTRALDLVASCGHVIGIGEWTRFLDVVESRHEGHAMLLQMAVFSLKVGSGKDSLGSAAQSTAPAFGEESYKALNTLARDAGKDDWEARAAGAVIAGTWRHSALWKRDADWTGLAKLFNKLPLAIQIKTIPLMLVLEGTGFDTGLPAKLVDSCYEFNYLHVSRLYEALSHSPESINLSTFSPKYLHGQSKMFGPDSCSSVPNRTCDLLREIIGISLNHEMKLGPWREEPSEMALFVLLAVQFDKRSEGVNAGLGKQLLDGRFFTRHEYRDLTEFRHRGGRDKIICTKQWMALNREKQAKEEPESVCTIS
jgi:hypothetical protein